MKTMMTLISCLVLTSASCNTPSDAADHDAAEAVGPGASLSGLGRKKAEAPKRVAPGKTVGPVTRGAAPKSGETKVEPRTLRVDVAARDGLRHYRVACGPAGKCDIFVGGVGAPEQTLERAVSLSSSCVQLGGDIEMAEPQKLDAIRLDVIAFDPANPGHLRKDSRPTASTAAMLLLGPCDEWIDRIRESLSQPSEVPRIERLTNCQLDGERFICNQIKAESGENFDEPKEDPPQSIETQLLCMNMCTGKTKIAPDIGCTCD